MLQARGDEPRVCAIWFFISLLITGIMIDYFLKHEGGSILLPLLFKY
jgi:hypothetical protein